MPFAQNKTVRRDQPRPDARSDGLVYTTVKTTGIYCRPICPAGPPLEKNVGRATGRAEAEQAGFRPCLRCRPELAPNRPLAKTAPWPVRRVIEAVRRGLDGDKIEFGLECPDFEAVVGVPVSAYRQTVQTSFAKMLLTDTALPEDEIAVITGYNDADAMLAELTELYHRDPVKVRRPIPVPSRPGLKSCTLNLAYRPPYDWPGLLNYFRARAVPGLEAVEADSYHRTFRLNGRSGRLSLRNHPEENALRLEVHATDLSGLMDLVWRVRRMTDLDADPVVLDLVFGPDPLLGPIWNRNPGLRVPVCFDALEFAVRAVAGQLISVTAATKLVGKITARLGDDLPWPAPLDLTKTFPGPDQLIEADLHSLGLTKTKATAVAALARAGIGAGLDYGQADSLDEFIKRMTALKGVGDWTAQCLAMRGLGDGDGFPAADLGIVKALSPTGQKAKPKEIYDLARRWRPWRSYAAMLLWSLGSTKEA